MKSKLILVPQFAVAVGALFGTVTLCAQGYGPPAPQPSSASVSSPQPTRQDPFQPDNPFFRKSSSSPTASAAAARAAKPLSAKDTKFLGDAASGGSWEVATGRSAEQKAQSGATKEIAARIVTDYSKSNKELVDLGKKKGLGISTEGKAQQISAQDFDKRYLNLVVQEHQEESRVFEKEAKSGDDADIKNWAAKTLPTIKQHLALAKDALSKAK
jgi:putative membrane protein